MAYSASPIDFDAGLACNGNNLSFYLGHLRRFAQDTSLVALSDALMQGNVSQAFLLAHTLKGAFLPAGRNLCLSSRRRTLRPAARRKSRKSAAGSGCVSRTARRI